MNKLEMSNLSDKEKMERIKHNGYDLRYVNANNRTEEMCLEAVRNNGCALAYIQNPTEEMCLEAVRNNGYALQYINNQTEEMCLEAVKQNGYALEDVPPEFLKNDLTALDYGLPLGNFKEENLKVFISAPMRGKTVDEIVKSRFTACIDVNRKLGNKSVEVINSVFPSSILSKSSLHTLGKSLELLSTADVAYFSRGWENHRGCRIEHQCAVEYGIEVIEYDGE